MEATLFLSLLENCDVWYRTVPQSTGRWRANVVLCHKFEGRKGRNAGAKITLPGIYSRFLFFSRLAFQRSG